MENIFLLKGIIKVKRLFTIQRKRKFWSSKKALISKTFFTQLKVLLEKTDCFCEQKVGKVSNKGCTYQKTTP